MSGVLGAVLSSRHRKLFPFEHFERLERLERFERLVSLFGSRPLFFPRVRRAARLSLLDHDRLDHADHAPFPEKNRPGAKRENLYR